MGLCCSEEIVTPEEQARRDEAWVKLMYGDFYSKRLEYIKEEQTYKASLAPRGMCYIGKTLHHYSKQCIKNPNPDLQTRDWAKEHKLDYCSSCWGMPMYVRIEKGEPVGPMHFKFGEDRGCDAEAISPFSSEEGRNMNISYCKCTVLEKARD